MSDIKQEEINHLLQLARDAVRQKDYDTATNHLISVFQLDSSNIDAYGIMGDMALYKKDYNTAESYYLRQIKVDPQSYEAHKNLGRLYWERTEYENAITEFKTAMQKDVEHKHTNPYISLASIYFCLGQYEEAYEWLYRHAFEVTGERPQSEIDLFNQAYYGLSCTISQNLSINDLDSLIEQIESKYNVSITLHLVVNPDAPFMPFRKTGNSSYEIDYDLDSADKVYEVLSSLILLDNCLGAENFDFHHFLVPADNAEIEFPEMIRNTMDADSTLSMSDLLNYLVLDLRTSLIRIYTDEVIHVTPEFNKYRPIHCLGMGNAIAQSYNYIRRLERIHAPRLIIYSHKVLLYMKSVQLFEYFRASDRRIDFVSRLNEHKVACAIYDNHKNLKDSEKRSNWLEFYRTFVNQVCPTLRYYMKLEEI